MNYGFVSRRILESFNLSLFFEKEPTSAKFVPSHTSVLVAKRLEEPQNGGQVEAWYDISSPEETVIKATQAVREQALPYFLDFGSDIQFRDFYLSFFYNKNASSFQLSHRRSAKFLARLVAELGPIEELQAIRSFIAQDRFSEVDKFWTEVIVPIVTNRHGVRG